MIPPHDPDARLSWVLAALAGLVGAAIGLVVAFLVRVVVASACRRRIWVGHPHGATVLTTGALVVASVVDVVLRGWTGDQVDVVPRLFVSFRMGRSTRRSSRTARCRSRSAT